MNSQFHTTNTKEKPHYIHKQIYHITMKTTGKFACISTLLIQCSVVFTFANAASPQCWTADTYWPITKCKYISHPHCDLIGTEKTPWNKYATEEECCAMSFADGCTRTDEIHECFKVSAWWPVSIHVQTNMILHVKKTYVLCVTCYAIFGYL